MVLVCLFVCLSACLVYFFCVCIFVDVKNGSCNFKKEMHTTTSMKNKTPINLRSVKCIVGLPFDDFFFFFFPLLKTCVLWDLDVLVMGE